MTQYTIDLNTRIVPPQRQVWRLFPGKKYRFLQSFERQHSVFLDLPGLQLPDGPITSDLPDLDARILAARAIEPWAARAAQLARQGRTDEIPDPPDRDIAAYADKRLPKEAHTDKGAVIGFFARAAIGDLVVVPDAIPTRRVLIGEFIDGPERRTSVILPEMYGDEPMPARLVRWYPPVNELELSAELSTVLRRPNAFTLLGQSFHQEIFDHSYGTYYADGVYATRLWTEAERFTTEDALSLSLLSRLASTVAQAQEAGLSDPVQIAHIWQVLEVDVAERFLLDLKVNINSPGSLALKSRTLAPLILAALFSLLTTASAAEPQPNPNGAKVVNTAATGTPDPCAPAVDEAVREALSYMQYDVWRNACLRAKSLAEHPRMRGDSRAATR
ncbi:hypothetical protein [Paracraurococcus lichenis]|uniref:Uncharacterized protein n=1 Tax=Paracraurococcus lichenis TaxID=3064888 RepID=A0ABT9E8D9_9PROT|nr:hypothetical protein [Paracraurococcus sp. LOR1-02]MDO9712472.1 hypothetical protein [Paracraurococcus sp. LOR1-02]